MKLVDLFENADPKQAYLDRQTPAAAARQARVANHQFADSFGGHSSNYR